MTDIKVFGPDGSCYGKLSTWTPTDVVRKVFPMIEIPTGDFEVGAKKSYTLKISNMWVSPHLENLLASPHMLKFDSLRDERHWTAVGPEGRIGDFVTLEEALLSFGISQIGISEPSVGESIILWAIHDMGEHSEEDSGT